MPKISIVMCTFNAEKYLVDSLDSVFNQPYKDFELIIVNDCSTDNSKDIIQNYTKHPEVVVLNNKYNEGVSFSRNKAFLSAKGEYIAIQDADDITLPIRFEKQVKYLDQHPEITVVGGHAIRINETGMHIGNMIYPPEETKNAFRVIRQFKLNPIIDPSCMFRRQPILDIGGYRMEPELRTVQDFDLWCRLLTKGHQQVFATDLVWVAFKRRSFPEVRLRSECFSEDSELNFLNNEGE